MGSRVPGNAIDQKTMYEVLREKNIKQIIEESAQERAAISNNGGNNDGIEYPRLLKRCACCGGLTIPVDEVFFECPICQWIDDEYQNCNPDSIEGENTISLNEAKRRFSLKGDQA